MGFLNRLFGKGNDGSDHSGQFSEPMSEDRYWDLIEKSLQGTDSPDEQLEQLTVLLRSMTPSDIVGFQLRTDKLMNDSYTAALWCAAYLINGGCSDDGFDYFRGWLISQGKEVYMKAVADPDSLISVTSKESDEYELEEMLGIAGEVYEEKTDTEIYELLDYESFHQKYGSRKEIELNWAEEQPETMRKICPRLFERYSES